MKEKSYKSKDWFKPSREETKEEVPAPPKKEVVVPEKKTSFPTANSIAKDFKSASAIGSHVAKLSDEGKKSFATKYGIPYKDVSEIRGNARVKFWNS